MDQKEKEAVINDVLRADSFVEQVWGDPIAVTKAVENMSWSEISKVSRFDKWLETEHIEFNKILGKTLIVNDYEVMDFEKDDGTTAYTLYLLLEDRTGVKRQTHTSAKIPVELFRDHAEEVEKRIKARVPIMFSQRTSANGYVYITVAN